MASFNKFRDFVENLAKGKFNFTDDTTCTVTVALSNVAPAATNSQLSDITQISYTNLSSRVVTGVTCEQTAGTVTFTADDLVLTASDTVPDFRYIVLYDDDSTNDLLIGYYDHGSTVQLTGGQTYTLDFGASGFATLS